MNHISLKEYAQYVAKVRKYVTQNIPLEEAVTRAVDECIEEGILAEFLVKNKAEVIKVSIYEYDKEFEEKKLRMAAVLLSHYIQILLRLLVRISKIWFQKAFTTD